MMKSNGQDKIFSEQNMQLVYLLVNCQMSHGYDPFPCLQYRISTKSNLSVNSSFLPVLPWLVS